jgi:uncharacterized RDD family membrane protein YckC
MKTQYSLQKMLKLVAVFFATYWIVGAVVFFSFPDFCDRMASGLGIHPYCVIWSFLVAFGAMIVLCVVNLRIGQNK